MSHAAHIDKKDTTVFGFWLYIMSDCLLFASLFATFAVLRLNSAGGPTAEELFSLPFVLLETLVLLTSSFTCGLAVIAMHKGSQRQVLASLAATGLLGLAFLGLEIHEFIDLATGGASWQVSAFLSAFFTLVGTHGLHVSLGLIWMLVLAAQIWRKGLTEVTIRRLMCLALFWHFLDVIWIFIFSFVYIYPLL